jgi:hypothetical protein
VPVISSSKFAEARANARVVRLESGHELTDVLEAIWPPMRRFLSDSRTLEE